MAHTLSLSLASAAVCLTVAYLAVRAALAVLRFRHYELAIPGPPTLPLLGNVLRVGFLKHEDILEVLLEMWGQRLGLSRFSMLHNLFALVSKPEDFAVVMRRKDLQDKSHFYYDVLGEAAPSGMLTIKGAKLKAHRTAGLPAFHPEVISSFQEVFSTEAEKFVASLEVRKEVVVQEKLFFATAWKFCRSILLSDEPTKEQEVFITEFIGLLHFYLMKTNERAFNPLLWPRWVWMMTSDGRTINKGLVKHRQFLRQLIADRDVYLRKIEGLEGENFVKSRKSLLDVLLLKHREDSQAFPYEDILDELLLFLVAAIETSTAGVSFALKMLTLRPDLQQKVYEEVSSVLGSGASRRSVVAEDMPKIEYTERFLKETMRMFPPIPLTARQVYDETELGGHVLPAGTTLVLNIFGLHRHPDTWPEPLRFDPDRFTAERSEGRHPNAYMPFNAGLRRCFGYKYAWAVMKTVLATVVRDFVVEPADDGLDDPAKFRLAFDVSLQMIGGVKIKFSPREA